MTDTAPRVQFHLNYQFRLLRRKWLRNVIIDLFNQEGRPLASLDYIFCSDEYLLEINRSFLHHDDLTDIITFELANHNEPTIGEIYISIERVKENAIQFKNPFFCELSRVMFHGALHLCGYEDKSPARKLKMTEKEDYYLELLENMFHE